MYSFVIFVYSFVVAFVLSARFSAPSFKIFLASKPTIVQLQTA